MAFKFFRRRQKLVLVLMVLLMVAFLVPTLFQSCDRDRRRNATVGYIGDKKVTSRMTQMAAVDLNLLDRSLRMGMGRRAGEAAFTMFIRQKDAGLAWVLLVHEAEQMGISISDDRVDSFLLESELTGETYQRELANLRENGRTEKELRRAVKNYLKVTAAFLAADVETTPSLPELRHTAGNLYEKIQLAMVSLPAEDYATDATGPSAQAIVEQFDRYKNLAPLAWSNKTAYRFGYRIPNRLEISWLFINEGIISRGVEPDEKDMMRHWEQHQDEFTKRVPIPTTSTAPVEDLPGRADTQPSQPVEPKFREVPFKLFSQAEPAVRRHFLPGTVDIKMNEIISIARQTAQRFSESDEPYSAVVKEMIRPADTLLKQKVASLPFSTKASVESIIEELEHLANVKIVYPFGEHEKLTLDGKIEVKIKPWDNITLGEALERIGKEAKFPPIKWVTCAGMKDVLFASEPIDLVPVSAGRTGMVSFEEINRHKLLGLAGLKSGDRAGRQSLLSIAVTAKEFQPPGAKQTPMIKSGSDYDRAMHIFGPDGGRLLWRLVEAEATHAPKSLSGDVRKEVIKDLGIVAGFKKATTLAETLKSDLEKSDGDLEKLAKDKKLDFSKTEMFSRNTMQRQTGRIFLSSVSGVGADGEFIKQAFTLVPSDPDNPGSDQPLAVIPLRKQRKVMLVQRIGYEPLMSVIFDYWAIKRANDSLMLQRWEQTVAVWFAYNSIAKRVNFRLENPSE